MYKIMLLILTMFMAACTNVQVKEIDPSLQISHVCIQNNPKVLVAEFIPVVRNGFERHGITTEVYNKVKPHHCEYYLTYTALKDLNFAKHLHHAELQVYRGVNRIAYAEYRLTGKGGFSQNKWGSVESKMDPVIDQLLANYTPEKVDANRKTIPDSFDSTDKEQGEKSKKLRELKGWFNEGLITEQEYKNEKQKVLSQ